MAGDQGTQGSMFSFRCLRDLQIREVRHRVVYMYIVYGSKAQRGHKLRNLYFEVVIIFEIKWRDPPRKDLKDVTDS